MKTEITIQEKSNYPSINIMLKGTGNVIIQQDNDYVVCTTSEAIELRDFLIQLNLGK